MLQIPVGTRFQKLHADLPGVRSRSFATALVRRRSGVVRIFDARAGRARSIRLGICTESEFPCSSTLFRYLVLTSLELI